MKKAAKIIFVSMLLVMALAMGIPAQAAAKKAKLLKKGKIHLIGSDMHNLSSRPQTLRAAFDIIDKKLGREAIAGIERMEAAVMAPTRRYIYSELDLI